MKRWILNKNYFWESSPFFRILLPFVGGIVCYDYVATPNLTGVIVLFVLFCLAILLTFVTFYIKPISFYYLSYFVIFNLLYFWGGFAISFFNDVTNENQWQGYKVGTECVARISEKPVEKDKSWKLNVAVLYNVDSGKIICTGGKARLYIHKDRFPMLLQRGDTIILPNKWHPIKNPGNPFEFDYARFCRRNNLLLRQSCSMREIRLLATNTPEKNSVISNVHDYCMKQWATSIKDSTAQGLVQAMLLGDDTNLDDQVKQSWADTGIIHIIAISGGNISMFFLLISGALWWLKNKRHQLIKYVVSLPLVWFYVLVAGAPSSAVRAAVMFSLIAFSMIFKKNNNNLNLLFATALILLLAQPMWLYSIGFQLSFVAVLSLLLFYKPIYILLKPTSHIAKKLWSTLVASLSAEILVAPLVIFYFHNFPLMFPIANVIAFLLIGIITFAGIGVIVVSWLPYASQMLGYTISFIIIGFNKIISELQQLSPVAFKYLSLSLPELILVYVSIAAISLFLLKQIKKGILVSLASLCLLLCLFCIDEWEILYQNHFVLYNLGKTNSAELFVGKKRSIIKLKTVGNDTPAIKKLEYVANPAHICWKAWQKPDTITDELILVGRKTVLFLNKEINLPVSFPVDYLIVNYNGKLELKKLKKIFVPALIIIGNNYSEKQQEKYKYLGKINNVNVHCIGVDGAFVL